MAAGSEVPTQNDTLTFVSEEMNYEEVKDIFECYGVIKYVNKHFNRFFIQFETPEQAKKAQSQLRRIYRVSFAHAKSKPRPRKNFRAEGEHIRFSNPEDLPKCGYTVPKETIEGRAMIEEYVNSTTRKNNSSAASRSAMTRESAKSNENSGGNVKGSENRRELAKSSGNQSRGTGGQNQREKSANPKPGTSFVRKSDNDDSSDDSIEEPKAGKRQVDEGETEDDEYEEAAGGDNGDEDDEQAEARALGAGSRRRVRIEGLDEIMNELGNDMAYSVIVANIPERYTLDEVYDLVEEVKPIAFSEMDYSIKMRVKFCEVFLNDAADVDYLKQKLNDFVICGKQLTVMEPAEILDETRWKA